MPDFFYFDFSSPYGSFAARRMQDIAARRNRHIVWKPFLLGAAFKVTGMRAGSDLGFRFDYMMRDWHRTARVEGFELTLPEPFPFASVAACRAAYWVGDQEGEAALQSFCLSLYEACFLQGLRIDRPDAVAEIAFRQGYDKATLLEALEGPALKQRLKDEVQAALDAGIFGSPMLLLNGEPFWGYDRLSSAEQWMETGGW